MSDHILCNMRPDKEYTINDLVAICNSSASTVRDILNKAALGGVVTKRKAKKGRAMLYSTNQMQLIETEK